MGVKLYCITNRVNGKMYVGITSTSMAKRWAKHLYDVRHKFRPTIKFQNALRKYGFDAFDRVVLFEYDTWDGAAAAEIELIAVLDLMNAGYNSAPGGDIPPLAGRNHSAASLQKISTAKSGQKYPPRSAAHCAALSASNTGKRMSQERLAVHSAAMQGRHMPSPTPEWRAKIGAKARQRHLDRLARVEYAEAVL